MYTRSRVEVLHHGIEAIARENSLVTPDCLQPGAVTSFLSQVKERRGTAFKAGHGVYVTRHTDERTGSTTDSCIYTGRVLSTICGSIRKRLPGTATAP
jgi:hypothetical protein